MSSIDPTVPLAVLVACGLVARHVRNVYAENARLRSSNVELDAQLTATCAALRDAEDREFEKDLELKSYRDEESRRALARKLAGRAMLS